jgi:septal ring factor EnvC (AmiA/AmiB activator)
MASSDRGAPDRSAAHLALQEVLRSADTFRAANDAELGGGARRLFRRIAAPLVHFFAARQVEWNVTAARALEATTRGLDEGDRWTERVAERLAALESRVATMEAELRAAREADADSRRKLAIAGVRLRELEEAQQALAARIDAKTRAEKG